MLVELKANILEAIFRLLQRVDLKGGEVPAFNEIIKALNTEYKEEMNDSKET